MRASFFISLFSLTIVAAGCGDPPIGQPCRFDWPKEESGTLNCEKFPKCHPLQSTLEGSVSINNQACPIDCIQMPSLECENLICVATQIDDDAMHMNGQCFDIQDNEPFPPDCPSEQNPQVRCMGYCTKECLTDAGCPKGYSCSAMAPFEATLTCETESEWSTSCTATCNDSPPEPDCPTSDPNDQDYDPTYAKCQQSNYSGCCACICYQFCPILSKKFCRKSGWDSGMFSGATTTANCGDPD